MTTKQREAIKRIASMASDSHELRAYERTHPFSEAEAREILAMMLTLGIAVEFDRDEIPVDATMPLFAEAGK